MIAITTSNSIRVKPFRRGAIVPIETNRKSTGLPGARQAANRLRLAKRNPPIDIARFSTDITRLLVMQTKVNRLLLTAAALASQGGLAEAELSFEKQVQPVLASACLSCHGEKNDKGELRLHTHEGLLEGSEYGLFILIL